MGRIAATDWLGAEPHPGNYSLRLAVYNAADPALARLPVNAGDTLELRNVSPVLE